MTASSALLNPARSGVYRTPADVTLLKERAGAAVTWRDIDLDSVRTKHDLLNTFAAACGFSETFGHNWDALADVLQDLSWEGAAGYVLHLRHADRALASLAADWMVLLDVLVESAGYWKARERAFVVFVDGTPHLASWP
ncbi:MAG: barstar family protein [Pseudomonadota bacterium]